jgi:predicted ArsR family transcriptional regulator
MQSYWIERLAGSTRGTMLRLLRRSRQTISELAATLGITDNAVRTHIASLQRDGLVEQVGVRRDQRGKPAQVFEITETAEEIFPKAYAAVLLELVSELERRVGPETVDSLLKSVGARVVAAAGASAPSGGALAGSAVDPAVLEQRIQTAIAILTQLGGELEAEVAPGGYEVRGHGCPLSSVVRSHHGTCAVAESIIATATGAPVTEHCQKEPRPRCAFHVGNAGNAGAVGNVADRAHHAGHAADAN